MQQFGGSIALAATVGVEEPEAADLPFNNRKTVEMRVPSHRAGLVIGHHGETLRRIEKMSQCKVQFEQHFHPNDSERRLTITGLPEDIEEAQRLIKEKVEDPGQAAAARFPTIQMPIPQSRVGLVIGKGGETIRELQERSGARITVQPETQLEYNAPPPTERIINITGDEENIQRAKELINDLLNGQIRSGMFGAGSGNRQAVTIQIPETSVGAVIGKKAETLRTLQSLSGCRIYVEPAPSNAPESAPGTLRNVHLTGAPEQVAYAQQLLNEKVQQNEAALQYAAAWESAEQPSVVYQNPAELLGGVDPTMGMTTIPAGATGNLSYDYSAYYQQYYAQMAGMSTGDGSGAGQMPFDYNAAVAAYQTGNQDGNAMAYAQYYNQYSMSVPAPINATESTTGTPSQDQIQ